jgi:hypothetical protein
MMVSDAQKTFTLRLRPGLITDGLFTSCRNPVRVLCLWCFRCVCVVCLVCARRVGCVRNVCVRGACGVGVCGPVAPVSHAIDPSTRMPCALVGPPSPSGCRSCTRIQHARPGCFYERKPMRPPTNAAHARPAFLGVHPLRADGGVAGLVHGCSACLRCAPAPPPSRSTGRTTWGKLCCTAPSGCWRGTGSRG